MTAGMNNARLAQITPTMQRYVNDGTIAGCTMLVARRGEIVHRSAIGLRDREAALPMTDDTIFRIYSMTKPIVATALMLLWEEGRFNLHDPVSTFLPAFGNTPVLEPDGSRSHQKSPMTVAQLLTHTSGLSYDFLDDYPAGQMYRDARIMNDATRTLEEVTDALAEIPLAFHPGTNWHYSVGIDVAARLIEVISGESLQTFLRERIFEPAGMSDTGFGVPEQHRDRVAAVYGLPDIVGPNYSFADLVQATADGVNDRQDTSVTYPVDGGPAFARGGVGLFSTLGDYYEFSSILRNGRTGGGDRIIGRKTLELMGSNHLPDHLLPWNLMQRDNNGYGFGLSVRVMADPAAVGEPGSPGEFGWAGAAKTYYWVDPVEDMVGVFMAQYMTGPVNVDHIFRRLAYSAIDT